MDMRTAIYGTVGVVAFVLGGIFARQKAVDGLETLEDTFMKSKKSDEAAE